MRLDTIISNLTATLSHAISKVCRPEPAITDQDFENISSLLQNGDCIVSRTSYELSNVVEHLLTGSFWGHAAIYLNGWVYEATTYGVRAISLERFVYMKDAVGVCRVPGLEWTEKQLYDMQKFCDSKIGANYDYSLSWGKRKKWYCSKLVFMAWQMGDAKADEAIKAVMFLGMKKVTPQNIWDSVTDITQRGVTK